MILMIIPAISASVLANEMNLVQDPGFEEAAESPWSFSDLNPGKSIIAQDESQFHSGKKSICFISNLPNGIRCTQIVKVKEYTNYKVSCWIKTENVGIDNCGAFLSVAGFNKRSEEVKGTTEGWKYLELKEFTTKKINEICVILELGDIGSLNTGKVWFDDVSVVECKDDSNSFMKIIIFIFMIGLLGAIIYFIWKPKKTGAREMILDASRDHAGNGLSVPRFRLGFTQKDLIIISAMTIIYLVIALIRLGDLAIPTTAWAPARVGESFTIDFGKEIAISRVNICIGNGAQIPFTIDYLDYYNNVLATNDFLDFQFVDQSFYKWMTISNQDEFDKPFVTARRVRFTVTNLNDRINEIAFFEPGKVQAVDQFTIIQDIAGQNNPGKAENLFDEQFKVPKFTSFTSQTVFDESIHARTAYQLLQREEPFEKTHPYLGHLLIGLGIAVFGWNPFGWRITGMLFGVAMIPLMYIFGKKLFANRFAAFAAALLMMFDFLHFVQSRIGVIDVYPTFFIILMYYFMYDYYLKASNSLDDRQLLKPLFWSGICFGLGAACKWITLYGAPGLMILFCLAKYNQRQNQLALCGEKKTVPSRDTGFKRLFFNRTLLYVGLFFVVIPLAIYFLSYLPYMALPGPGHGLNGLLNTQIEMIKLQSNTRVLEMDPSYISPWWSWPLVLIPCQYLRTGALPAGQTALVIAMGNPAIWWGGILAFICAAWIAIKNRDRKAVVLFLAIVFQYAPWALVNRPTMIYLFFSTVPFIILAITYTLQYFREKYPQTKYAVYTYLGIVILLFCMFYPVLSGMIISKSYVNNFLVWFKNHWFFFK